MLQRRAGWTAAKCIGILREEEDSKNEENPKGKIEEAFKQERKRKRKRE